MKQKLKSCRRTARAGLSFVTQWLYTKYGIGKCSEIFACLIPIAEPNSVQCIS